ncbi:MAG: SPOR domain-containing protein [Cruoricaptor ignavus]|nr:SPOR domain-containing protein [Cruoricaptor ignavus]
MKSMLKYSLIFLFSFFYKIEAQQVTKADTLSGTPVTISMDKKISDILDSMEEKCTIANTKKSDKTWSGSNESSSSGTKTTRTTTNRALSTAEICKQTPRILGVKIQLAIVKSNAEANEVKAYFRRRFPHIKVETDASLRPNYKILAGSYFTKESAASDLAKIRQHFKSAISIQYRVFCAESK